MAEQLGIQQVLIQRGAVKRNKRTIPAPGQIVESVGDQLLARAAFADNQHRFVERGEA